jgi:F-box and leucine-rich repeat protein GRR1
MANYLNAAEGEGFDDEMPDEENDFEGLDGTDMAIDPTAQNLQHMPAGLGGLGQATTLPPLAQSIPVPPPAPGIIQQPFAPTSHGHPSIPHLQHQQAASMGPLAFSSFMTNDPARGHTPLSANGRAQASMASLSSEPAPQPAGSTSANVLANSTGASTAPMYEQPHDVAEQ